MNTSSPIKPPPVALIAGPTASGKSDIALALAILLPVTIINADASQVYRDLRIVSARPPIDDEALVPHRLFGTIDGGVAHSAAAWALQAKAEIDTAVALGRLPVLVGGTGLYLGTLLNGIAPIPAIDPAVRAAVRAMTVADAHIALTDADPISAARLSPNDTSRVLRALEVVRATGRTITAWQSARVGGIGDQISLAPLILLPPRDWVFARCDARFEAMLAGGGIAEVRALLARGLNPALPVMRAIGVREIAAALANPEAAQKHYGDAKIATRQYAKRQYTWFRNQPPVDWLRIQLEINNDIVDNLAIILRDMALTA